MSAKKSIIENRIIARKGEPYLTSRIMVVRKEFFMHTHRIFCSLWLLPCGSVDEKNEFYGKESHR